MAVNRAPRSVDSAHLTGFARQPQPRATPYADAPQQQEQTSSTIAGRVSSSVVAAAEKVTRLAAAPAIVKLSAYVPLNIVFIDSVEAVRVMRQNPFPIPGVFPPMEAAKYAASSSVTG